MMWDTMYINDIYSLVSKVEKVNMSISTPSTTSTPSITSTSSTPRTGLISEISFLLNGVKCTVSGI